MLKELEAPRQPQMITGSSGKEGSFFFDGKFSVRANWIQLYAVEREAYRRLFANRL